MPKVKTQDKKAHSLLQHKQGVCKRALVQIKIWYKRSDRFVHLLVGMPSYDKYVEHMQTKHPDKPIQSQKEFFKEALQARYSGGSSRCC